MPISAHVLFASRLLSRMQGRYQVRHDADASARHYPSGSVIPGEITKVHWRTCSSAFHWRFAFWNSSISWKAFLASGLTPGYRLFAPRLESIS